MGAVPKPNFPRRIPKKSERGNFSKEIRERVHEKSNGICQQCKSNPGEEVHHVMFRSRSGRGVETNALFLCHMCHSHVHADNELAEYWINVYTDRYGPRFYKDEYDS